MNMIKVFKTRHFFFNQEIGQIMRQYSRLEICQYHEYVTRITFFRNQLLATILDKNIFSALFQKF